MQNGFGAVLLMPWRGVLPLFCRGLKIGGAAGELKSGNGNRVGQYSNIFAYVRLMVEKQPGAPCAATRKLGKPGIPVNHAPRLRFWH